jgi:hypothetical protein
MPNKCINGLELKRKNKPIKVKKDFEDKQVTIGNIMSKNLHFNEELMVFNKKVSLRTIEFNILIKTSLYPLIYIVLH